MRTSPYCPLVDTIVVKQEIRNERVHSFSIALETRYYRLRRRLWNKEVNWKVFIKKYINKLTDLHCHQLVSILELDKYVKKFIRRHSHVSLEIFDVYIIQNFEILG